MGRSRFPCCISYRHSDISVERMSKWSGLVYKQKLGTDDFQVKELFEVNKRGDSNILGMGL